MKNKKTKRTFFRYEVYECTAVEEYLEQMAQKGWLLQSVKKAFFKFRKIEPTKIKYSVDVLDKISMFDHKDSDEALEYREYCKAAGWNYVCQDGKIQIFYTEGDKEAISIHTDEEEKFKAVFKPSLYNTGSKILLIISWMFLLHMFLWEMDSTLSSNLGIVSIAIMFSGIVIFSIEVISFFYWVIKARWKLKENKFMPYNNYKQLKIKNIVTHIYSLVGICVLVRFSNFGNYTTGKVNAFLVGIICIPTIIMSFIRSFINKKRYSKNTNIVITVSSVLSLVVLALILPSFVIFGGITGSRQDKIPYEKASLTLMDFGYKQKDNQDPYIRFEKSILAERTVYMDSIGKKSLDCTMFYSKYPWIIKFKGKRLVSYLRKCNCDLKLENTKLPKNIKVYSDNKKRNFVLVSENKVVEITKDLREISEDEFLDVVYKKVFE